jgi:periplasmic protein TonB
MKPILITIALIATFSIARAQQTDTAQRSGADTAIVDNPAKPPEFPGRENMLYRFFRKTIRYPASGVENHIQGTVLLTFIVEKDGSLSDIKVVKSVSKDIDAEAVRVMKLSPKWIPGMLNGVVVRVLYSQPISFALQGY